MSKTMTVSEARAALAELVSQVVAGEEVTLTRHGKPVVVVVRPEALRSRWGGEALAAASALRDAIERARAAPLRRRPRLSEERAGALVAGVQAGRTGRAGR